MQLRPPPLRLLRAGGLGGGEGERRRFTHFSCQESQNSQFQIRQVAFDDSPNDLMVDTEVLVDNDVAESRGLRPYLIGVLHSEL